MKSYDELKSEMEEKNYLRVNLRREIKSFVY